MCACNGFSCWPSIGQALLEPILSNPPNFDFLLPRTHLLSEFTKNSPLSTSDDSQCLQKLTIPCHHQTLQRPFSSMNPAGLFYKNYPTLIIFILLALLLCSLAVNPVSACFHQTPQYPDTLHFYCSMCWIKSGFTILTIGVLIFLNSCTPLLLVETGVLVWTLRLLC